MNHPSRAIVPMAFTAVLALGTSTPAGLVEFSPPLPEATKSSLRLYLVNLGYGVHVLGQEKSVPFGDLSISPLRLQWSPEKTDPWLGLSGSLGYAFDPGDWDHRHGLQLQGGVHFLQFIVVGWAYTWGPDHGWNHSLRGSLNFGWTGPIDLFAKTE